jgi:hypothetical protein
MPNAPGAETGTPERSEWAILEELNFYVRETGVLDANFICDNGRVKLPLTPCWSGRRFGATTTGYDFFII